jgi:hypothetical protein
MDELTDVVLLGKQLVSDNPEDWLVCRSLADAKHMFVWWENLIEADDASSEAFSAEQLERLRSLRDEYDSIPDYHCIEGRQAARNVLARMFAEQLSITQVAVLCNLTSIDVAKSMISSRKISTEEAKRRVEAEKLLREGVYQIDAANRLGFSKNEIQQWAKSIGIKTPTRNKYGEARKPHVRERAMELYDQGLRGKRICEILEEEMPVDAKGLTRGAVSQWANRTGRTESSTNARD